MDVLARIKRLILLGDYRFTLKARDEMDLEDITEVEVAEAIMNAHRIDKVLRSTSPHKSRSSEPLYVIKGLTLANRLLYTKGKIAKEADDAGKQREIFYILISCKEATR
jgi:hypothetical protein